MSFNFNPALSAGDPGVMCTTTGSMYPQLLSLLISNANPSVQVDSFFDSLSWAVTPIINTDIIDRMVVSRFIAFQ